MPRPARVRPVLIALALVAPATLAGSASDVADIVNPTFDRELFGWKVDGASEGFGLVRLDYRVRTVDPPSIPEMDDSVALLSAEVVCESGEDPVPCAQGAATPADGEFCFDSEGSARTEMSQLVAGIRTTTLQFDVAAAQTLDHSGFALAGSRMFMRVNQLDENGNETGVHLHEELIDPMFPDFPVFCGIREEKDTVAFRTVTLDLASVGMRRGDRVQVRFFVVVHANIIGCRSFAQAHIDLWVDNLRFVPDR